MFEWVAAAVERLGYVGIALLTLLENVFPPIPSELIMPFAGFVSRRGGLDFWGVALAGTIGSFAGAIAWYEVGRRVGAERLRSWVDRRGCWLGIDVEDVERATGWFERHGAAAVLLGRLVPGVRTFISVPAGLARMPRARFAALTFAGTVAWTVALTWAGHLLGANYDRVQRFLDPVSWVVLALVLAFPLVRAFRRWRRGPRPSPAARASHGPRAAASPAEGSRGE